MFLSRLRAPPTTAQAIFRTAPSLTRHFAGGGKKSKKPKKGNKKAQAPEKPQNSRNSGVPGEYAFSCQNVTKSLPDGRVLFGDVNLSFLKGVKIGVLGANGAGKSSFMKVLAGMDKDYDGQVWVKDGLKMGYLAQEPELDEDKTVMDNVLAGVEHKQSLVDRFEEISMLMGEPDADFTALLDEQGDLQLRIDDLGAWELGYQIDIAMRALNVPAPEARVESLSGGEKRRVALCRLLLQEPDVLLLDEPTNHLDAASVGWLEHFLQAYKGTVLAVTHDRYFLQNVAAWILEVDRGRALPFEGSYTGWLEYKQEQLKTEQKKDANKAKAVAKELEWIRMGARGGNKARLDRANAVLEKEQDNNRVDPGAIVIAEGPRLGRKVLSCRGLAKSIVRGEEGGSAAAAAADGDVEGTAAAAAAADGDVEGTAAAAAAEAPAREVLFKNVSFDLNRGDIVGVVGSNGCGKSTLFGLLTGENEPDEGTVEIGESVYMGKVSQSREGLHADATVYQEISQGVDFLQFHGREVHMRAYVGAFNLKGSVQEKRVSQLSGGERNRVHLAKVLRGGYNVLLLDEPTNDLDVDTLRALEEALRNFDGAVIIISHDRWFLNRLCTHTLAFESDGHVEHFPGNFEEYEKERPNRLAGGNEDRMNQKGSKKDFKNISF